VYIEDVYQFSHVEYSRWRNPPIKCDKITGSSSVPIIFELVSPDLFISANNIRVVQIYTDRIVLDRFDTLRLKFAICCRSSQNDPCYSELEICRKMWNILHFTSDKASGSAFRLFFSSFVIGTSRHCLSQNELNFVQRDNRKHLWAALKFIIRASAWTNKRHAHSCNSIWTSSYKVLLTT
jgi:hypothetical protein